MEPHRRQLHATAPVGSLARISEGKGSGVGFSSRNFAISRSSSGL
jgi:hypothetical protein